MAELNRKGEVNSTIPLPETSSNPVALAVIHNQIYILVACTTASAFFSPGGRHRGEVRWEGIAAPTATAFDAARKHSWWSIRNG